MKAIYHQGAGVQVELDVLKNADGKADLGRDKEVFVTAVPIAKDGAAGTCTLVAKASKGKASKAEAKAIEDAEAVLAAAQAAAAADPDNTDLATAVTAAQDALDALLA